MRKRKGRKERTNAECRLSRVGRGRRNSRREKKKEEEDEERTKRGVGGGGGVPLAGSEPSVRSRGRASHEDCCAAARDPTGIGRAGSELPARASPSLRNLAVPRGAERGPCVREAAPPPSVPREPDERARIQRAREREEKRERKRPTREDSDGRRKSEIAREGGRDRDEEERGREERERAPPPPPSGPPTCVRPSVCSDQEDGLTGPSVWPFDTRCVDRLADDELSGTVSTRFNCRAARRRRCDKRERLWDRSLGGREKRASEEPEVRHPLGPSGGPQV